MQACFSSSVDERTLEHALLGIVSLTVNDIEDVGIMQQLANPEFIQQLTKLMVHHKKAIAVPALKVFGNLSSMETGELVLVPSLIIIF